MDHLVHRHHIILRVARHARGIPRLREYVLILDDWLTIEPEASLAQMLRWGGMGGMMGGGSEPRYTGYLVNGRLTGGPSALTAARGERVSGVRPPRRSSSCSPPGG